MQIVIQPGVRYTARQIKQSKAFIDWQNRVGVNAAGTIAIMDVDEYDGQIHSLMVKITPKGAPWPIRAVLRSPTVDVLTIVTDTQRHYVVLVEQFRPATGLSVLSNPAGGIGWNELHYTAAMREVREELGLSGNIPISCALLVPHPVLASPGLTNERVFMMRAVITVARKNLDAFVRGLQNKRTGVAAEGESIRVHVMPADQARQQVLAQPEPDAKTLLSFGLAGI